MNGLWHWRYRALQLLLRPRSVLKPRFFLQGQGAKCQGTQPKGASCFPRGEVCRRGQVWASVCWGVRVWAGVGRRVLACAGVGRRGPAWACVGRCGPAWDGMGHSKELQGRGGGSDKAQIAG